MADPRQEIDNANAAISAAAMLLGANRDLFHRFLKEARDMENFGHIVDPTLFKSSERQAMNALLKPLYEAALAFLRVHDAQIAAARAAMEKVNG